MLFSRAVSIESTLPAAVVRFRLRARAASPDVVDLAAFRRRQIIGWRLSEASESSVVQPEYGETLDVDGVRLVGLVEPFGAGSRIRGRITLSLFTRMTVSAWMLALGMAAVRELGASVSRTPAVKMVGIVALVFGVAVSTVRYSLWSRSRVIESRLRRHLDVSGPRAAA